MSKSTHISRRVTAGLLFGILACVGLVLGILFFVSGEETRTAHLNVQILPEIEEVTVGNYDEVMLRPLFWQDRRPLEQEQAPVIVESVVEEVVELEGVRLLGVIVQGNVRTALLEVDGAVLRLQQGQTVKQWKLQTINEGGVRFTAGGKVSVLSTERPKLQGIHLEALP